MEGKAGQALAQQHKGEQLCCCLACNSTPLECPPCLLGGGKNCTPMHQETLLHACLHIEPFPAFFLHSFVAMLPEVSSLTVCGPPVQACVTIQRHVRGHAARQLLRKQVLAVTRIQAQWRCHLAAAQYTRLCQACVRLQAWARATAATQRYRHTRAAVLTLQVGAALCVKPA